MNMSSRVQEFYRSGRVKRAALVLADERRPQAYKVFRAGLFVTFYALSVWLFITGLAAGVSDVVILTGAPSIEVTRGVFRYGLTEGALVGVLFALVFGPLVRGPVYDALNLIYDLSAKVVKRG